MLDWVNGVFDRVLVEQEGVQPATPRSTSATAALADESLSICVVHGEPTDDSADEIRTEEARLLAATIRRAVDDGWPVRDRDTGERAAGATYGDVVVLVPRRTALDIYLEAFRRAGVPVRAEGGRSFFQRQEVRDLANMLQAIDDPLDQVALVASLRSAAFGCTDEDIYLHHARGQPPRLPARPRRTAPTASREALALLRDLHDLRSRVSLAQLVRATLEQDAARRDRARRLGRRSSRPRTSSSSPTRRARSAPRAPAACAASRAGSPSSAPPPTRPRRTSPRRPTRSSA